MGSQCPAFLFTNNSSPLRPCCWAQSCFSVCPTEDPTVNFPTLPSHWTRVLTSVSGVYVLGQTFLQALLGPFHLLGCISLCFTLTSTLLSLMFIDKPHHTPDSYILACLLYFLSRLSDNHCPLSSRTHRNLATVLANCLTRGAP